MQDPNYVTLRNALANVLGMAILRLQCVASVARLNPRTRRRDLVQSSSMSGYIADHAFT
jgi:hypothetical protein